MRKAGRERRGRREECRAGVRMPAFASARQTTVASARTAPGPQVRQAASPRLFLRRISESEGRGRTWRVCPKIFFSL